MDSEELKLKAAEQAFTYVKTGMKLGLGTGSTAAKFVEVLGAQTSKGFKVICVPTSEETRAQAEALGIPLTTLDETPFLDLVVDGADEIDEQLHLTKGGGGALLREKIVAMASERMIVIADESKQVKHLGAFPLPIEVVPFGLKATIGMITELCRGAGLTGPIHMRHTEDGKPFLTDGGHYIVDCAFGQIPNPMELNDILTLIPGIVEHGLFLGVADVAIIAGQNGITVLEAK